MDDEVTGQWLTTSDKFYYKKEPVDPRWSSKRRIFCVWTGCCSVQRRSALDGKRRDRDGEEGKRDSLGIYDSVLITVQPGGADTLPGAAGWGAGDLYLCWLYLSIAPSTMVTSFWKNHWLKSIFFLSHTTVTSESVFIFLSFVMEEIYTKWTNKSIINLYSACNKVRWKLDWWFWLNCHFT